MHNPTAHTHSVMTTVLTLVCAQCIVVVSISGNNFLMISHTQHAIITAPVLCVLCNMYCMILAWDVCTCVLYMSFIGCVYTVLHVYCTHTLSLKFVPTAASQSVHTCAVHTGGVLGAVRGADTLFNVVVLHSFTILAINTIAVRIVLSCRLPAMHTDS